MSEEELPSRAMFVRVTVLYPPGAWRMPFTARLEFARIETHALDQASPAYADWANLFRQCVRTGDVSNAPIAPRMPSSHTDEYRRVVRPPHQVAMTAVEIAAHGAFLHLSDSVRQQFWHVVRNRPPRRTAEQNEWVRDIWRHLFTDGPIPSRFDCDDPFDIAPGCFPPRNVRQLLAEVLTHPEHSCPTWITFNRTQEIIRRAVLEMPLRAWARNWLTQCWFELYGSEE